MAAILKQTSKIARQLSNKKLVSTASFNGALSLFPRATISGGSVRFASTSSFSYLEKKTAPRRLPAVYKFLLQADERTHSTGNEPIPKITLSHVSVSFAGYVDSRSHTEDTNTASTKTKTNKPNMKKGKKGSQKPNTNTASKARVRSINTAGTKIIMKLDVKNAHWLSERVRERIMLMEKSRIKDGELVLTSTKTRKQENNFEDVVAKKQKLLGKFQEIINAASYAPLPPSDGLAKKLSKLAVMGKEKNAA
ncbi:PREDICTED: uncharacterized protein LOC109225735 isoform X1 [Nicotiana attenuata]|uniref:Uncharacterized protein n=1 Tax=Nicotiana attenuata TaxID=49451 RepID=A0A1J6IGD1_NICAT|nr:PREDICTED: uncharacterized protein LOC109225735 isoform X1 [Nicotiana attenuata]OIT03698.1 hypothetical protein A4A49_27351 [Nicotiana attenuata]